MNLSKEQIDHKIDLFERMLNSKVKKLKEESIPEGNIPDVYRSAGSKAQIIGLFKLSLGECDDAAATLTEATEWYRDAVVEFRARRDSPADNFEGETTLLDYLYCGLLCGDEELLGEGAEYVRDTEPEHYDRFETQWRYSYTQALAAIILDTGDQQEFLKDLEESIPAHDDSHERFFTALWTILSGIENRDRDQFSEGATQFLEWHDGQVDFKNKVSPKDLVCRQVAALIILARRNEMDVRLDSEYIPECVYEIV